MLPSFARLGPAPTHTYFPSLTADDALPLFRSPSDATNRRKKDVLVEVTREESICLFHCLSQLHRATFPDERPMGPRDVIEAVRTHLRANWERMSREHSERMPAEAYLATVGDNFAGELEIDAAAELFNVAIFEWYVDPAIKLSGPMNGLTTAVLHAKFFPLRATDAAARKALPTWDLVLHRAHFYYLRAESTQRIHDAAAERPAAAVRPAGRSAGSENAHRAEQQRDNNLRLREAAEERARRAGAPAAPVDGGSCRRGPLAVDDEASLRLIQEIARQEQQEAEDRALALQLGRAGL